MSIAHPFKKGNALSITFVMLFVFDL